MNLKFTNMGAKNWTDEEEGIIKNYYDGKGAYYCYEKLNRTRSISSIRKKANRLNVTGKRNNSRNKYSEECFKEVVENSNCLTDMIKYFGLRDAGGNYETMKKYIAKYNLDTSHFKVDELRNENLKRLHEKNKIPLDEILVKNSTYSNTTNLKERLYEAGLKDRECELCGQGEEWNGKFMALILDHISGVNNDNELQNLRIVCPNCNATLPTHAGRNSRKKSIEDKGFQNECQRCGRLHNNEKYCSQDCYLKHGIINLQPSQRKVERPPYEQLICEIEEMNYSAVGRKYGVSDNAIRKWVRNYEKKM